MDGGGRSMRARAAGRESERASGSSHQRKCRCELADGAQQPPASLSRRDTLHSGSGCYAVCQSVGVTPPTPSSPPPPPSHPVDAPARRRRRCPRQDAHRPTLHHRRRPSLAAFSCWPSSSSSSSGLTRPTRRPAAAVPGQDLAGKIKALSPPALDRPEAPLAVIDVRDDDFYVRFPPPFRFRFRPPVSLGPSQSLTHHHHHPFLLRWRGRAGGRRRRASARSTVPLLRSLALRPVAPHPLARKH